MNIMLMMMMMLPKRGDVSICIVIIIIVVVLFCSRSQIHLPSNVVCIAIYESKVSSEKGYSEIGREKLEML